MKKENILLTIFICFCMFAHGQENIQTKKTNKPSATKTDNQQIIAKKDAKVNLDKVREIAINSATWSLSTHLTNMSYQNMCAAFGILKVAEVANNDMLRKGIEDALYPELLEGKYPHRDNALKQPAHRWFGFVPFELYRQTKNPSYLKRGIEMADEQYIDADKYGMPGYTPRLYVDDIYGATVLQSLAYSCTGDLKFLDRAIQQVLFYSGKFMQDNGLFLHSPKSPFFWGRGNGWCAAAYPELLSVMPDDHPMRDAILTYYRRMMEALLKYQGPEGMWYQLLDDHKSWPETSCTAMFIFAMSEGVRNGWLPSETYNNAVVKAWNALEGYVDDQWRIREVCAGTGFGDRAHYLNRPRIIGDAHGQAPLLWAASSILKMNLKKTENP